MRIVDVSEPSVTDFMEYVRAHASEHDDSFALPEDLASFDPEREPAAIAIDDDGAFVGAASLMIDGYETEGNARFRILHAVAPDAYSPLLEAVLSRVPADVRRAFLFLPARPSDPVIRALTDRGFTETRRAYLLEHPDITTMLRPDPPDGVTLRVADPDAGEHWARVINQAFGDQPGRYDMTTTRASETLARDRVISDATLIAWRDGVPVAVVLTVVDSDEEGAVEIESLGVVPVAQHQGVGSALLRAALSRATTLGYRTACLSASERNETALALYFNAGFRVADERVCWQADLERDL